MNDGHPVGEFTIIPSTTGEGIIFQKDCDRDDLDVTKETEIEIYFSKNQQIFQYLILYNNQRLKRRLETDPGSSSDDLSQVSSDEDGEPSRKRRSSWQRRV